YSRDLLRRVMVGDPDHRLAARRGAGRVSPVAAPRDRTGGLAAGGAPERAYLRRDHTAPALRRPPPRQLGRLVDAIDPDARAEWVVGGRSLQAHGIGTHAE